ncbi:hypothetical protein J4216_04600 [Candidatus Woesearchaeota archaeon]|nr:hypothetical protein [Candidatus Woesearchaeota archaeon]
MTQISKLYDNKLTLEDNLELVRTTITEQQASSLDAMRKAAEELDRLENQRIEEERGVLLTHLTVWRNLLEKRYNDIDNLPPKRQTKFLESAKEARWFERNYESKSDAEKAGIPDTIRERIEDTGRKAKQNLREFNGLTKIVETGCVIKQYENNGGDTYQVIVAVHPDKKHTDASTPMEAMYETVHIIVSGIVEDVEEATYGEEFAVIQVKSSKLKSEYKTTSLDEVPELIRSKILEGTEGMLEDMYVNFNVVDITSHFKKPVYTKPVSEIRKSELEREVESHREPTEIQKRYLEIELRDSASSKEPRWKKFNLIAVPKSDRTKLPGYKIPFYFETDLGPIRTHMTGGRGNPNHGDPLGGEYATAGMRPWFAAHPSLKSGDILTIEEIDKPKDGLKVYKLGIKQKE